MIELFNDKNYVLGMAKRSTARQIETND